MDVRSRHQVRVSGREGGPVVMLAHGFGCDQNMWRLVLPALERDFSVLLRGTPGVHPREESHPVVAMRSIAAATGAQRTQETGPQRPARNVRCSNAGTSGGG